MIIKLDNSPYSILVERIDLAARPGHGVHIGALRSTGHYTADGEPILRAVRGVDIKFMEKQLPEVIAALVALRNGKEEIDL